MVKPVTLDRLRQALDRARARLETARAATLGGDVLARLTAALPGVQGIRKPRILVRDGSGRLLLPLREILRFSADEGSVSALARGARWPTDYTLTELEDRIGPGFARVSRSELVNTDHITRFEPLSDGSAELTLSDRTLVRVSRRRAPQVRRALEA